MNIRGILIGILSLVVFANFIPKGENNNVDELIAVNDTPNEYIFTNHDDYPVVLNKDNVTMVCLGNEEDVALAYKYLTLNVTYIKNNERTSEITVKEGEQVRIKITDEYVGEVYPSGDVTCKYEISLEKAMA